MLDLASQIGVSVFGLGALGCMQSHDRRWRRLGVVLGLIGQPAWYAQLVIHEQWGMLPVFFGYTSVWCFGFWNCWVRKSGNGQLAMGNGEEAPSLARGARSDRCARPARAIKVDGRPIRNPSRHGRSPARKQA